MCWIPRLLDEREGPWISYLKYNLKNYGGCFLFRCNYDVNDLDLSVSNFYLELLRWWAELRSSFSDVNYSQNVIWNNKDIRINNKPVFYKMFFDKGIIYLNDLQPLILIMYVLLSPLNKKVLILIFLHGQH